MLCQVHVNIQREMEKGPQGGVKVEFLYVRHGCEHVVTN